MKSSSSPEPDAMSRNTWERIDATQSMASTVSVFPLRVLLISKSNRGIAGATSNQGNRYSAMISPINIIIVLWSPG
jgi:hypothetical protein